MALSSILSYTLYWKTRNYCRLSSTDILQESYNKGSHQRILAKILQRSYLASTEKSYKSLEKILQGNFDLLNTFFAGKEEKSEVSCQNLPRPSISCTFCKFLAIFFKKNALYCKKLPRILQLLSDRLITKTKSLCSLKEIGHTKMSLDLSLRCK